MEKQIVKFSTEQENFWACEFGDDYINRNKGSKLLASNVHFFSNCLKHCDNIKSVLEFGSNIGMNLKALQILFPELNMSAIEINPLAANILKNEIPKTTIYNLSILDFKSEEKHDLVLIKGVLIHLNPEILNKVYKKLTESTSKYLLICEYYNRTPVTIPYRGHNDRLFKRDFAGEILDASHDLELIDYGFAYHRDNNFPQDDISWFLLKKIIVVR